MLGKPDEAHSSALRQRTRPKPWWAAAVVLAGLYCWLTAGTAPFTWAANVAVGAALIIAVALAATEATAGVPWRPRHPDRTSPEGALWPWWVATGLLVGWELWNYFHSTRHSYPTMSSIYDHVAGWQWAKAVIIGGWLLLGWEIVASFAKDHVRR